MTDETIFVLCDWLVVMNNSNGGTGRMKQLYPTCAAQGGDIAATASTVSATHPLDHRLLW